MKRDFLKFAAALALAVSASSVFSQATAWPTQPVRIIVGYPAGGGVDVLARALAQELSLVWKQPVIIDNRPGANTVVAAEAASRVTDGHTLFVTTDTTFTVNPHVYNKLPYDPVKSFSPVTMLVSFDQLLVAGAGFQGNSVADVIAQSKAKPGALSYASYGAGSQPHLATEMLKSKAGIDIVHVPYRGVPQALTAVIAGEVALTWSGIASAQPQIVAKRIKPLGYGGKTRSPLYPDIPTFAELGYPEVDANVWIGLFAPSSMPAATVNRINSAVQTILSNTDFRAQQVSARGFDRQGLGPVEFRKFIAKQLQSRAALVRTSGTKLD
jgi:tripartite-type tricarboxylate transporter receptor subunit TctC